MALSILNFVFYNQGSYPWCLLDKPGRGGQMKIPRSSQNLRTNRPARSGANEWGYSGRTEKTLVPMYTIQRRPTTKLATLYTRTYIYS